MSTVAYAAATHRGKERVFHFGIQSWVMWMLSRLAK